MESHLPFKEMKNFDPYTWADLAHLESEVLGGEMHRSNIVESHRKSDRKMLFPCSLLHNDTKGRGSSMSTAANPD